MYERTQAQINLNALEANIAAIRQKIGPDTKLLGVIKADAYGHGAAYIGRRYEENFDFYGVACIEEALELRRAGVTLPILVLGPVFSVYLKIRPPRWPRRRTWLCLPCSTEDRRVAALP